MKYTADQIDQINDSIDIIEYVSQYVDLIKDKNDEYWCPCVFHNDNLPSLSFNAEKNLFYCLGCGVSGTPIIFVQMYHKLPFPKAVEHLINYGKLNIEEKEFSEILECLHKLNHKKKEKKIITREYLSNNVMDQYEKKHITEWVNEGITPEILEEYQVRYHPEANRIVFPIRDENGIIAIKGRSLHKNFKDLGIVKYIYYQPIVTNNFLFGLYKNKKYIQEKKECIIVEAEKGVMLLESWEIKNVVGLTTSHINEDQINLLLSLKVDLIFAFDKDIKEKDIRKDLKKLTYFTNVYYLYDRKNLLFEKDSPYDKGLKIWNKLYESRYKL